MPKTTSNSVARKAYTFAAVVGVVGTLGGSIALAHNGAGVAQKSDLSVYTKEQCKDGGWMADGFKNQGQCVSYFAQAQGGEDTEVTAE